MWSHFQEILQCTIQPLSSHKKSGGAGPRKKRDSKVILRRPRFKLRLSKLREREKSKEKRKRDREIKTTTLSSVRET